MTTHVLLLTGVALALLLAGCAYNSRFKWGKPVFALGVVAAVGLLLVASTACAVPADPTPSERSDATATQRDTSGSASQGAAQIQKILQDYKTNSIRAEDVYVGQTMLVGGEIKAFDEYWLGVGVTILPGDDPNKGTLPQVWLERKVSLIFASNDARTWLHKMNVGDQIAVQCLFGGFSPHSMEGPLELTECQQVPETAGE